MPNRLVFSHRKRTAPNHSSQHRHRAQEVGCNAVGSGASVLLAIGEKSGNVIQYPYAKFILSLF
jgi:hypothetical protein